MRGKDLSFKIVEKNASLKQTTRERIAVFANGSLNNGNKKAKTKKDIKTGSSSVYEFLFGK